MLPLYLVNASGFTRIIGLRVIPAGDAARAERQQQLAVRRELLDEVVRVVGDPEEPFAIDAESVRDATQIFAPRADDVACGRHHHEERIRTTKNDDLPFRRRRYLRGRFPFQPGRQFSPWRALPGAGCGAG